MSLFIDVEDATSDEFLFLEEEESIAQAEGRAKVFVQKGKFTQALILQVKAQHSLGYRLLGERNPLGLFHLSQASQFAKQVIERGELRERTPSELLVLSSAFLHSWPFMGRDLKLALKCIKRAFHSWHQGSRDMPHYVRALLHTNVGEIGLLGNRSVEDPRVVGQFQMAKRLLEEIDKQILVVTDPIFGDETQSTLPLRRQKILIKYPLGKYYIKRKNMKDWMEGRQQLSTAWKDCDAFVEVGAQKRRVQVAPHFKQMLWNLVRSYEER